MVRILQGTTPFGSWSGTALACDINRTLRLPLFGSVGVIRGYVRVALPLWTRLVESIALEF